MECSSCGQLTPGIIDDSSLWCDKCGTCLKTQVEWVHSYDQLKRASRQQVYCRVKRFTKWVRQVCPQISNLPDILDLYSSLEFTWGCYKKKSKRIYFFAKPVMLQVCCGLLGMDTSSLPRLKDKTREKEQHEELASLQKTQAWSLRDPSAIVMGAHVLANVPPVQPQHAKRSPWPACY